ncbi:MAG TPA: hypothetical protein VMI75_26310 [Polyangiaceae bacterium]|nr:hypothetical protein [Polyangiaceae bacterium]
MLVEYAPTCERAGDHGLNFQWAVPVSALPGLLGPFWWTKWLTFGVEGTRKAPEAFSLIGLSVVASAWILPASRSEFVRSARLYVVLAGVALVLACAPGYAPFRWTFRWLLVWHLALGIAAAKALDRLIGSVQAPSSRTGSKLLELAHPGWLALIAVILAALAAMVVGAVTESPAHPVLVFAAICASWRVATTVRVPVVPAAAPTVAAVAAILFVLQATPAADTTTWPLVDSLSSAKPLDPRRTYLAIDTRGDLVRFPQGIHVDLRVGNTPLVAGLSFVNGYTPMLPRVVTDTFPLEAQGWFQTGQHPAEVVSSFIEDGRRFEELGIDGLILPDWLLASSRDALAREGWAVSARLDGGYALERGTAPLPRAWLVDAAESTREHHARLEAPALRLEECDREASVTLEAPVDRPALVVFKRADYPGYRATIDGVDSPTQRYLDMLVAVPIAEGTKGKIAVAYRPQSLVRGTIVAVSALIALALWILTAWLRRAHFGATRSTVRSTGSVT